MQNCLSHIRFFQSHILNHIQDSKSQRLSYIKLSFGICVNQHFRIVHIAFYPALIVGCYRQSSNRSVTLDLKRQKITLILHHTSHHRSGCQKPSQSSRCYRACIVRLSCSLYRILCRCRKRPDLIACRCCSYNIICHNLSSPSNSCFIYSIFRFICYLPSSDTLLQLHKHAHSFQMALLL